MFNGLHDYRNRFGVDKLDLTRYGRVHHIFLKLRASEFNVLHMTAQARDRCSVRVAVNGQNFGICSDQASYGPGKRCRIPLSSFSRCAILGRKRLIIVAGNQRSPGRRPSLWRDFQHSGQCVRRVRSHFIAPRTAAVLPSYAGLHETARFLALNFVPL